ncbi:hypothetical protein HMPREF0216_03142 [Clostridium celatum DSM 1785]|uniref:Uncharacterized protein n=1 Tax=Clostridium celatum DSM 1785 TaxID=545697 RepID=L1Q473_9CLOT|nr:hypothetical protein HMPREF0216_03142 [Clostridium celatum DSM 1785]
MTKATTIKFFNINKITLKNDIILTQIHSIIKVNKFLFLANKNKLCFIELWGEINKWTSF